MATSIFKQIGSVIAAAVDEMHAFVDASTYTWIIKSENYNTIPFEAIAANTTHGPFEISLPINPILGDAIRIMDVASKFNVNNIIVKPNGKKIMDSVDDYTLNTKELTIDFIFINEELGWRIVKSNIKSNALIDSILYG